VLSSATVPTQKSSLDLREKSWLTIITLVRTRRVRVHRPTTESIAALPAQVPATQSNSIAIAVMKLVAEISDGKNQSRKGTKSTKINGLLSFVPSEPFCG